MLSEIGQSLSLVTYMSMGFMVFLGAAMQGVGGLGYAMFCAPLAAIFFPQLVPGPLLAVGAPLALLAYLREQQAVDMSVASAALLGRVLGTVIAAALLLYFPPNTMALFFAILIVVAVVLSCVGWKVQPTKTNLSLAGLLSGVMGTITSAGGPPFAIAMQQLAPPVVRATLGVVFFAGTIVSLSALTWTGQMQAMHWIYSALLMPWMLGGFACSSYLARHVTRHQIRRFLLGTALASACAIFYRTLAS